MTGAFEFPRLERAAEPAHQVLSKLIHHCAPDTATRTTLAAALVISMWQIRHRRMSRHVPSAILLNAAEAVPDPVDDTVRTFIRGWDDGQPKQGVRSFSTPIRKEDACGIMATSVLARRKLDNHPAHNGYLQREVSIQEQQYRAAQQAGFGAGGFHPYSKAWVEPFGLLTDNDEGTILRLDDGPDRTAFRSDVLGNPDRLLVPAGIGRNLGPVIKTLSVSGSLTEEFWDEELVMGIIKLGLPVVFLPHTAADMMVVENPYALDSLSYLWRGSPVNHLVQASLATPPIDWFDAHARDVRRRLRHLPGACTYEFAILQVLHQLGDVCHHIVCHAGNNHAAKPEDIRALFWDLHARAFRGITLGVAALAWHCLGFAPGCPRDRAVKVLKHIRLNGTVALSDLLFVKGARLDAATRDILLERLSANDLIRMEGKSVTATTFSDFVTSVHARSGLPEAPDFRQPVAGNPTVLPEVEKDRSPAKPWLG